MSEPNIAARTAESVSVACPVCGERVSFRPIVEAVNVRSANAVVDPVLLVSLRSVNTAKHACQETRR